MSRSDSQFKLRLPPDLKKRIESAADASGRSLNAELVHRLERSFIQLEPDGSEIVEVVVGPVEGDSEPAAKMLLRIRRGLIDSLTKAPTLVDESPDDQPVKRTAKAKK